MDPKDAENYRWNIFDTTKVWPHKDYPLREVGVLTLNEDVSSDRIAETFADTKAQ